MYATVLMFYTFVVRLHLCWAALSDSQDVADDSDAPQVRLKAHWLEADHLRGHKLRGAVHHHQRFTGLWQTQEAAETERSASFLSSRLKGNHLFCPLKGQREELTVR